MLAQQILPNNLFDGQNVFITGGSSGINLAIAEHFVALGANVGICGRNPERLEQALQQLQAGQPTQVKIRGYSTDVRDYAALESTFEQFCNELGSLDVLVCGAAGNFMCPAEDLSANGFKTVVDIDLMGAFNASRAAFPYLKRDTRQTSTQSCILFISAGQAYLPFAFQAHAGAAKAGIENLMQNLALEWGRYGIRCNSIVPGAIAETVGLERVLMEESHASIQAGTPLGRLGSKEDVAQAAVFLASPLASFITGSRLGVDGGGYLEGSALVRQSVEKQLLTDKG